MKILNIHGYGGSSENAAFSALMQCGYEVVSPQLDYDVKPPDVIRHELLHLFLAEQCQAVVGTSLGGFFAAQLCAMQMCKTVLVNPCLIPAATLPNLTAISREMLLLYSDLMQMLRTADTSLMTAILGEEDEVVEHHAFTRIFLGDERCILIPGGKHSGATLPLETLFKSHKDEFFN